MCGTRVSVSTASSELIEETTCKKCLKEIDKRGLRSPENKDVKTMDVKTSNVQAYIDDVSEHGRRAVKYRLEAATNAMFERNAARRESMLKVEAEKGVIAPGTVSLTTEEVIELAELGRRILLSLSCDANGEGLPCRTDRFEAMGDMIKYLNIGMSANHLMEEEE